MSAGRSDQATPAASGRGGKYARSLADYMWRAGAAAKVHATWSAWQLDHAGRCSPFTLKHSWQSGWANRYFVNLYMQNPEKKKTTFLQAGGQKWSSEA